MMFPHIHSKSNALTFPAQLYLPRDTPPQEAAEEWDSPGHPVVLLMAGVDHMIPWEGQSKAMAEASAAEGKYQFAFSNLEAMADHLRTTDLTGLPVCQNEFHGSGAASVLGGTISSRIYLKQTNAEVEQLLVHQTEPAAALARLLGTPDVCEDLIQHAWKMLLVTRTTTSADARWMRCIARTRATCNRHRKAPMRSCDESYTG